VTRKTNSEINHLTINENFPVPGQDNDTQVFRDNFESIKTNLRRARDEMNLILDGEDGVVFKSDSETNFNTNIVSNVAFRAERLVKNPPQGGIQDLNVDSEISFLNGSYQIYRLTGSRQVQFTNFPGDPNNVGEPIPIGVGKITLELYSTNSANVLSFVTSSGSLIKKSPGFPTPLTIESGSDPTFLEVWRHRQDEIFVRYLGKFSI
jgi:hypothetical protein